MRFACCNGEVNVASKPSPGLTRRVRAAHAHRGQDKAEEAVGFVEFVFARGGYTRQLTCSECGYSERLTDAEIRTLVEWAADNTLDEVPLQHARRILALIAGTFR